MPPARLVLLALVAVVLAAPAAPAAPAAAAPPAATPPVAVATAQVPAPAGEPGAIEVHLVAAVQRGRLCLHVSTPAWDDALEEGAPELPGEASDCEQVPRDDLFWPLHVKADGSFDGVGATGGAVRADIAAVELVGPGGAVTRVATVPAPAAMAGTAAADLRFYVAPRPAEVTTWRLLGADERLLDERDDDLSGRLVRPPREVAAGDGWRLAVEVRRQLEPTPGNPGRRVRAVCLSVRRMRGDGYGESWSCLDPTRRGEPSVGSYEACGGQEHVLAGFVRGGAGPRHLVTTAGRRRAFRLLPLPPGYAGEPSLRIAVATAGPGAGVRSVVEADGDVSEHALEPPQLFPCGMSSGGASLRRAEGGLPLGGDAVLRPAGPVGPRIFVRDNGEELCVAFERGVRTSDCGPPPPFLLLHQIETLRGATMTAGVVDGRVTRVRVRLSSGAVVEVPAAPDPAYGGRYAGTVAFFGYVAPAGTTIREVEPLAPHGTSLFNHTVDGPALTADAVRQATVRVAGRVRTIASAPMAEGERCDFLAAGPLPRKGDPCPEEQLLVEGLQARAGCRTGLTLSGLLRGQARTIVVVLRGGRRIARPVVRLRRGGGYAWVAVPRRAAVARVELRGPGHRLLHRYRFPAPPAAEHCGYTADVDERLIAAARGGGSSW